MSLREILLCAVVVLAIIHHGTANYAKTMDTREWCSRVCGAGDTKCAPPCQACPAIPACPKPVCPTPTCPPLPPIPACPQPVCPQPVCPKPTCPLTPPPAACPKLQCPAKICNAPPPCPKCPACPPPPVVSPIRKPRPPGYEGLPCAPVGIFKYYNKAMSWYEANQTCTKDGAHLAIPNTKAELGVLKNIMKNNKVGLLHLGFHDNLKEGHYISVLGESHNADQRAMWHTNQPNGGKGENCAVLESANGIHDYSCTHHKFTFVCEVPY